MERVIEKVDIIHCSRIKKQIGLFHCNCGFSFTRKPEDDVNSIYQIKSVGQWEPFFEKIESYNSLNPSEMERLNDLKQKYINYKIAKKRSRPKNPNVKEYREKWLELMRKYPHYSSEKLRVIDHKVYTYLYRHDKEWLNKNRPKVKNVGKKEVDWEERDNNLLLEVKAAYKKIMEKEKPTRITIYSIRREIERPNYLSKKTLNKLPKTREYLNNIIETVPEFQIRRVHYAFEILQKENKTITEYALKKAAQLPTHCDQTVQDEINKILSYHQAC